MATSRRTCLDGCPRRPGGYRASVVVQRSAADLAAHLTPAAGTVEPLDDSSCVFETGADSVQSLAVHLSLLDADFVVRDGPPS